MKNLSIKNIVKGHVYQMLDVNKELHDARQEQCLNCPLLTNHSCNKSLAIRTENKQFKEYKTIFTSNLINSVNNEDNSITGQYNLEEYTSGCGCNLDAKRRLINVTCPINLWKQIDNEYLACEIKAEEILEYIELGVVRFAKKYNRQIIKR